MRLALAQRIPFPAWAKKDARYRALDELDRYLDGEIYNHLPNMFYEETTRGGVYIQIKDRRPAVQFNLYKAFADQIARECFAGFNAPVIQHPDERVRKFLDAIKEESEILSHMIELTNWGTVGSSVATFKVVPFGKKKAKLVMKIYRAKQCTPFFNELNELNKLRVHYIVSGSELIAMGILHCFDAEKVKPGRSYWFVRDYGAEIEQTFYAIPENKWFPADVASEKLVPIEQPEFQHKTNLDFVPAHWFRRRTGKERAYDGECVWEAAIPNVLEFDYSMSAIGAGCRYNAAPQVVIKGEIQNAGDDGRIVGGPSRYLHFAADHDDPDGEISETGADAHLLEATGAAMKVALEFYGPLLEKAAKLVISASQKNPDKLTTAMSSKAMAELDKPFVNVIQEFRTVFGDNGYLKALKKMGAACVEAKHPLAVEANITIEELDAAALKWPPVNPVGAQEFLYLCQGAAALVMAAQSTPATENQPAKVGEVIMTGDELRSYITGSIDTAIDSANRDYLTQVSTDLPDNNDPEQLTPEGRSKSSDNEELHDIAEAGMKAVQKGIVSTEMSVGMGGQE